MKLWMRVSAAVAVAAIFIASAFHLRRPPDPIIRGRPASQWASELLNIDYAARSEAQSALEQLGEAAVPQLRVLLRKRNLPFESHLVRLSSFLPALQYDPPEAATCRARSAEMLALLGSRARAAIPDLIHALAFDPSTHEFERALVLIGSDSIHHLGRAVKNHRNVSVRKHSAAILREFQPLPAEAIAALIDGTRDRMAPVREQAALSLGATAKNDPKAADALIPLTRDPGEKVRAAAARALGEIGLATETALSVLNQRLTDPSASVRLAAAKSIWAIQRDSATVVPVLTQILAGFEHRWEAAYALGNIGPEAASAVPQLVKVLGEEQISRPFRTPPSSAFALGKVGPPAIPALTQLLTHPDPRLRTSALLAFGFMGTAGAAAVPNVLPLLNDQNAEVRHVAALTLPALGAKNERVVAGLADCLTDEDIYIRSAAAAVLRDIAPDRDWVVQSE